MQLDSSSGHVIDNNEYNNCAESSSDDDNLNDKLDINDTDTTVDDDPSELNNDVLKNIWNLENVGTTLPFQAYSGTYMKVVHFVILMVMLLT